MRSLDVYISVTQETRKLGAVCVCCSGNCSPPPSFKFDRSTFVCSDNPAYRQTHTHTHPHIRNIILYAENKLRCSKTLVYIYTRGYYFVIFSSYCVYDPKHEKPSLYKVCAYVSSSSSSNQTVSLESRGIPPNYIAALAAHRVYSRKRKDAQQQSATPRFLIGVFSPRHNNNILLSNTKTYFLRSILTLQSSITLVCVKRESRWQRNYTINIQGRWRTVQWILKRVSV